MPMDHKKELAVIAAVAAAVTAIAALTDSLDKIVSKLPAILALVPWFAGIVAVYYTTVLFIYIFRERREGKRARAQKRREEIRDIYNSARLLLGEAEKCYGPPEKRVDRGRGDFQGAMFQVIQTLVQASAYGGRVQFYGLLVNLQSNLPGNDEATTKRIEPHLRVIENWIEYAHRELSRESLPELQDPFAKPSPVNLPSPPS